MPEMTGPWGGMPPARAHRVPSEVALLPLPCRPRHCLGRPFVNHDDVRFFIAVLHVQSTPDMLTPGFSATSTPRAITKFKMPAMSPTMTEGGIASWKKGEGDGFAAGDVLLEIETDKAVIDVQDGQKNVPVGKVIALLAEEGDDISNIEVPEDAPEPSEAASTPKQEQASRLPIYSVQTPAPKATHHVSHSRPLFPSVARLLQEYGVENPEKIKGTGLRGCPKVAEAKAETPLDGLAIRQLIVQNMYQTATKARSAAVPPILADFDSVIADYLPPAPTTPARRVPSPLPSKSKSGDFLDGLV
ncbi:hypothetical protein BC826DRAFT_1015228 [Russula brevipes]|nr:hypothetical protein BC826DRAFT_1015228 [Russula brevipes]